MRILFLTSRLPYPPDRGDRLRAFNFLRVLSAQHECHLISFIASTSETQYLSALEPYCSSIQVINRSSLASAISVGVNIFRKLPLQTLYYRSQTMQRLIDSTLASQKFDLAYIHLFRMAPYLQDTSDLYRIVDLTDAISSEVARSLPYRSIFSRLLYQIELPRIISYENLVAATFDECWLISPADRDIIASRSTGANLHIIRNGADAARFHPLDLPEEPYRLIFVGHMGVFHNIDAARFLALEILPLLRKKYPQVTLQLAGASPAQAVQELANTPGVEVTGFIPDLNLALNSAAVFIAPLRFSAGVQNKVLEAMAAARPVITTTLVNQGIGATPGQDLLIADQPDMIVAAVERLLENPGLRRALGQSAMAFVQSNFSWDFARQRLDQIAARR